MGKWGIWEQIFGILSLTIYLKRCNILTGYPIQKKIKNSDSPYKITYIYVKFKFLKALANFKL
jgi:hypothetical protein